MKLTVVVLTLCVVGFGIYRAATTMVKEKTIQPTGSLATTESSVANSVQLEDASSHADRARSQVDKQTPQAAAASKTVPAQHKPDQNEKADEREAALRQASFDNLKYILLGMHNYVSQHKATYAFPPAYISKDGKPLLSWRVAILPYLEQDTTGAVLYKQFHLDEPWDSQHNKALIAKMPVAYRSPKSKLIDGRTVYLTARGGETAFPGEKGITRRQITDGLSNTIAVIEVDDDHAVPWTKPDDWSFEQDHPTAGVGNYHPGGFLCGLCDGSARWLPNQFADSALKGLLTIAGGETIRFP
jgi:hypothetical protein